VANGVGAGIHYPIALPYLQAYQHLHHGPADFPVSLEASGEILSLPIFPELTDEQQDYVVAKIASAPCLRK
jgi:dTDP-4-amino-4,6-dideoxygalactose transaminase